MERVLWTHSLVNNEVHHAGLNDNWFFKAPGQLFDTRAFKRHLENFALPPLSRAQVFTRLEGYRVHLLNRLGQLKDTFPAKIVKGLAFSPLTDIRSFVHTYLLDENLVDVKTLKTQLETLPHFENLAADVRQRIDSLTRIDELDKERAANRRRRITNTYVARRVRAEIFLTDTSLDTDLLAVIEALPALQAETPYRVFSVRVFNDSKRLEAIKNQLVSLARLGNPEWKRLPAEEVFRELNLVPNPNYLYLAGNWQLTLDTGEILTFGGFVPSLGFPAAQTAQLQTVAVHADAVLCIENLTSFHEFVRLQNTQRNTQQATLCTLGNPSPAARRLLRLLPDSTPIYHWSDLDYGGFNILSQLRRLVRADIQPYCMDIETLDANYSRSRPLTASDKTNLKKLLLRPELKDVREVIAHILERGVKLEQEGIE